MSQAAWGGKPGSSSKRPSAVSLVASSILQGMGPGAGLQGIPVGVTWGYPSFIGDGHG